jgi:AcrR family transcriptional regulator
MTTAVVRLWAMSLPTRRPTAEIRELILDAAQHLFREHGYAGTTTKQIAARAGVAESLVFGQFGTKPELFEIAAVAPFRSFVDAYIESWPGIPPEADPETLVKSFVDGFFRLLMENRRILQDCTSESFRGGESAIANLARAVQKDFARALMRMRGVLESDDAAMHFAGINPSLSLSAGVGMTMSLVLLDDWVFDPDSRKPGRKRILHEITTMIMHGLSHRPTVG